MNGWLKTGSTPEPFKAAQLDLYADKAQHPVASKPVVEITRSGCLWRSVLRAVLACLFSVSGSGFF